MAMLFGPPGDAVALAVITGVVWAAIGCGDGAEPLVIGEDENDDVNHQRVFVTSNVYSGNLEVAASEDRGLDNADHICNLHAEEEELGGDWKAWMSTQDQAATDRIDDDGPWFLVDEEQRVVDDLDELVATGPQTPINMMHDGDTIDSRFQIWTGTEAGGQSADDTCADWTSESDLTFGQIGTADSSDGPWTEYDRGPCNENRRFYCFEQ